MSKINYPIRFSCKQALGSLLIAVAIPFAATAQAGWSLDGANSNVSYLSTKVKKGATASVTERNQFKQLSGVIDDTGKASVTIDLASVETNIPIRNERMQKFVLNVAAYPNATITATPPPAALRAGSHAMQLDVNVSMNGKSKSLQVPVLVATGQNSLSVASTEPVLLQAADFGMDDGLVKLTELAKLLYIPTTVPVSFQLTFTR